MLTKTERLIDEMNEIESQSDQLGKKLPKAIWNRYWVVHQLLFIEPHAQEKDQNPQNTDRDCL